jgi:DUF1680 family protein
VHKCGARSVDGHHVAIRTTSPKQQAGTADDADGARPLTLLFDPASELKASVDDGWNGVTVINAQARDITKPSGQPKPITLDPYYLWANRGAGEMTVWLSTAVRPAIVTLVEGGILTAPLLGECDHQD